MATPRSLEEVIVNVLATKRSALWGKAFTIHDDAGRRQAAAYIGPLVVEIMAEARRQASEDPLEVEGKNYERLAWHWGL